MSVDRAVVNRAIAIVLRHLTARDLQNLVARDGWLFPTIPALTRLGLGYARGGVADALAELRLLDVLAAVGRVRPDCLPIVGTPDGQRWLAAQLDDIRQRTAA